jgi:formate dehydrogenase alpha subunit
MNESVTLTIDGHDVQAKKGETVLEAALQNGIEIPNLCYNKKVTHTASCRLCVVEIEGRPGSVPSCTTPVEEGMNVTAFNDELQATRRTILDLLLSNHNDDCISCVKEGACELQDLAFRYSLGRSERRFPPVWEELGKTSDFSSPVLNYDASKCIQCKRCVKACAEIQGKGILTFVNRGIRTSVGTGYDEWVQSLCDGCGECVQICPVGAITPKQIYGTLKRIRQKDIRKSTVTTCPYCGVGCQLEIATRRCYSECYDGAYRENIIQVKGADGVPNYGKTCVKGRFGLDFVTRPERLKKPLIRKDGELVEAEWPEAISLIARRFEEIKSQHGADALAGLSSARCTNEENFVFQKFIRSVVGTNNVDHCARLCHASTVAGLATTLGSGAMTNSIAELEFAKVILVTGSNTTETHPVIGTLIKRAVQFNGAKLIVVDPRRIDLVRHATLWLRQNSGSDVAWINGLINAIIQNGWQDEAFIREHCENYDAMKEVVAKYDPATVEEITGIKAEDLVKAARLYAETDKGSIVYSMGITQHSNGTDNVKSLANLAMVTGNIGRESTGVNPLRGQNNVQGACDMGALPNVYPGYQKVVEATSKAKFEEAWGVSNLSDAIGLSVVEIMHAAYEDKVKGLYIMGENPMVSDPNLNHVRDALEAVEFLVVQDIFLSETAQLADVVLPAQSFAEKDGNYTNTERRILPIRPVIPPVGESREDWSIVQSIARAMGHDWGYRGVDDIIREINQVTPQYGGITPERIANGELLQWPCPDANHPGTKYLHRGKFIRGKGLFSAIDHLPPKEEPCDEYPYVMSTGRMLFHYHTGTMTRKTRALPEYCPGAYVELCKVDCEKLGVDDGEVIRVSSRRGTIDIPVKLTDKVVPGNIFIPFHFSEAAANMLTLDELDPVAKIPELKVCAVKLEKITS